MPAGKDGPSNRRGGGTTKKNAFCSFCRKSYRDVGPLVEGPGGESETMSTGTAEGCVVVVSPCSVVGGGDVGVGETWLEAKG